MNLMIRLFLLLFCFICISPKAHSQKVYSGGSINLLSDSEHDWIWVKDGITPTTLSLWGGANVAGVGGVSVEVFDQSRFGMSGGTLGMDLRLYDFASASILGGSILGDIQLFDSATGFINGGTIYQDIEVFGGSLTISGGSLLGSNLKSSGNSSLITIAGSSFEIDGTTFDGGLISVNSGVLSGFLMSGDSFSLPFSIESGGSILVSAIPEPSTYVFLLGGLTFIGLMYQRRRKQ